MAALGVPPSADRANERASDCRRAITNAKRLATLPALVRSLDRLTREARLIRYGLRLVRQVKLGKRLHDVTHVYRHVHQALVR